MTKGASVTIVPFMKNDPFIARVVGRRQSPPAGEAPSREARRALAQMAAYRTRAPKGVYRYESHEAANRDRERWTLEAMQQQALPSADS